MEWSAWWVSIKLAICTTAVLIVVGLPLAAWLARRRSKSRVLVETLVALPIVLPPTVLGFYLLIAMGPRSSVGRWLEAIIGAPLVFSFAGVLVGSVLFNLPFAVRPFTAALLAVDRRLVDASWCLGVSRWRTFRRVVLPLAWPGIVTGIVLTFARTIGEFGVVLMIGGNIRGETRTAAIALYDQVQAMDYAAANRTALLLLGFSFAVLLSMSLLERRWRVV